jgi:hypothetical protein
MNGPHRGDGRSNTGQQQAGSRGYILRSGGRPGLAPGTQRSAGKCPRCSAPAEWTRHYMEQRFKRIRIVPEQIGNALRTRFLRVPPNQREYSWKDKHVRALLDDLKNVISAKGAEYFLGTIVVSNQDENPDPRVVDGQQRLATTLILIAAIRDHLHSRQDPEARKVESIYMLSPVLGESDKPRLSLNDRDRVYFHARVLLEPDSRERRAVEERRPTRPSHALIDAAAKTAKGFVASLVKGLAPETAKAQLREWLEFLDTKAVVIWVEVPDDRAAYTIFETMNDRGLDLSAIDLIKNHLFYMADDQSAEAERAWSEMIGVLEGTQDVDLVKDFVRHYWIARNGSTRSQELFSEIKERAANKTTALELLARLRSGADKYVALLNPEHGLWAGYNERTRRNLATLIRLGVKQIRPLLLAAFERFPKAEMEYAVRLAVSWSVRLLATGEQGAGAVESDYGRTAQRISNGEIKDAQQLALELASLIPADDAFANAFATMQAPKPPLARYYLRALERALASDSEPENVPNDDPFEITLEHILPQNYSQPDWPDFDAEQHALFAGRIANMALLKKGLNSELQSKPFGQKKGVYAGSDYQLTRELADQDAWTPDAVKERGARLGRVAVKAWPLAV